MNRQSLDHQVRVELLEEWDQEPGGVLSAVLQSDQCDRNQDAGRPLKSQLGACSKAEVAAMNNFKVVVRKTDRGEGHRGKHGDPDERIAQVRPEQCRHQNRDGDQQAAHGWRARLFLMRLRSLFADVLPDLEIAQAGNHDRPNDQASKKSGEASERGAESQVTKNTEWRKIMVELQVEQPVEQSASDTSSRFSVLSSQRQGRRECRFLVFQFHAAIAFPLCTSVFPVVQALVLYHRGTQGKPSNPPPTPVLSSQFSVSLRLGRRERRVFVATSQAPFPVSRLATLSTIRHRLRESRARATRPPLRASRRIPLSYPFRQPLPPSASPGHARRAGNQVYCRPDLQPDFLQCNARTRDADARRSCRVPAFHLRLQSGDGRAWRRECRQQP